MKDSIFTKIIYGKIDSFKVLENENFLAFLDVNPVKDGHTLVIPKLQVDYIYDLPEDVFKELFVFSKKVAKMLENSFSCNRIGISVVGLEVPHAHIHLIPINKIQDMNFENKRAEYSNKHFTETLKRIKDSN
ncbi:MAG: HIT domain-containing protein [Flavobacteriales bacterium]|jgi:histidine triad (HIT) family protein|nr:HIT domain-containing protein [Flavobacteriales bacterium]MDG1439121.1 HIT domain-containing protein [Flavobacteriales bacterium]MDG1798255.1 HIT domain-containing protein [Flavobacteriales bacterium]